MRFNYGRTPEDQEQYLRIWHFHFAWWPVLIKTGDTRWLETVNRRWVSTGMWSQSWEYRSCH